MDGGTTGTGVPPSGYRTFRSEDSCPQGVLDPFLAAFGTVSAKVRDQLNDLV